QRPPTARTRAGAQVSQRGNCAHRLTRHAPSPLSPAGRGEQEPAFPARFVESMPPSLNGKPTAPPRAKVAVIFGTRPEAIKLAPVVLALRAHAAFTCRVCVTAQHRQMLDQVLEVFGIRPDEDLDLMQPNQTLGGLTARAIDALDRYLAREWPEL